MHRARRWLGSGIRYKVVTSLRAEFSGPGVTVRSYGDLTYIYVDDLQRALRIAEEILYEGGYAQIKPVDLEDFFAEVM